MAQPTGKKPIIVRPTPQLLEFDSVESAIKEASRLATKENDEFIVYVPVSRVFPEAKVTVEAIGAVA